MGKWNYEAMTKSYLMYFKPVGLLAAAGWPGSSTNDYDQFWHPRFMVAVPDQLVKMLFPFLEKLEEVLTSSFPIKTAFADVLCESSRTSDIQW